MYPRIRALREDNDFNQTMIAGVLGMSQTGYSKYETGENDISPDILVKLAYFYDTNVEYLLGITDSKAYQVRSENQKALYKKYRQAYYDLYRTCHMTEKS